MYKKHISFEDFDGEKIETDLYFNFTVTELSKLNLDFRGGMSSIGEQIVNTRDGKKLYELFDTIICGSYGRKEHTEFGVSFVKKPEYVEIFKASKAYDALWQEYFTHPEKFLEFFNNVMPGDTKLSKEQMRSIIAEAEQKSGLKLVESDGEQKTEN